MNVLLVLASCAPPKQAPASRAKAVDAGLKKLIARMEFGDINLNWKKDYRSRNSRQVAKRIREDQIARRRHAADTKCAFFWIFHPWTL